jgi:lipopolysaccharide/colanic/teichoic acid biosynthesis glycosyltransferase
MTRALDVLAAVVLLIISAPLLLCAAAAVLVTSGRPVFFGHRRVGRNGVPFRCWKLRTMQTDAERVLHDTPTLRSRYVTNGYKLPLAEDPRVTRIGGFLRRSYLDELPQLFNVLNGTMSLVGPRPIVDEEVDNYGGSAAELLAARPGIFGAWAAEGRARPPYPERIDVELTYVRTRSLTTDLTILVRSIPVVLLGQGPDA